jgi:triosephosphate isomerase
VRQKLLAANWKMNLGPTRAAAFIRDFRSRWKPGAAEVAFFPSALAFSAVREASGDQSPLRLGVQNVYTQESGAFTGENSAAMALDAGADYVLVGHSERRHVFGETDEQCAAKCAVVESVGLVPMLCVGETLEQRHSHETSAVVTRQLQIGLSKLAHPDSTEVIIAYEPVWCIGTGETATCEDIANTHGVLRSVLHAVLGGRAAEVRILYGGSVTPATAGQILATSDVDGVLVGGASLEVDSWLSICES